MLDVSVPEEACPHNLAPTASTTAALAMGDALAVALLEARGFTARISRVSHPGGTLGRRLSAAGRGHHAHAAKTCRASAPTPRSREGLLEMTRKGLGMAVIVDDGQRVLGIFTDGDLRRALDRRVDVHTCRHERT